MNKTGATKAYVWMLQIYRNSSLLSSAHQGSMDEPIRMGLHVIHGPRKYIHVPGCYLESLRSRQMRVLLNQMACCMTNSQTAPKPLYQVDVCPGPRSRRKSAVSWSLNLTATATCGPPMNHPGSPSIYPECSTLTLALPMCNQ